MNNKLSEFEVQRYTVIDRPGAAWAAEDAEGHLVMYCDYMQLKKRLEAAKARVEELESRISEQRAYYEGVIKDGSLRIETIQAKYTEVSERYVKMKARMLAAEAELARRDAAAAGPVDNPVLGYADSYRVMASRGVENVTVWGVITILERFIAPLFTAAPPAVLPPAMTYAEALKASDWKNDQASIWVEGANWMREQCLALGAQPQKVIAMPGVEKWRSVDAVRSQMAYLALVKKALEAAGVKWKVAE